MAEPAEGAHSADEVCIFCTIAAGDVPVDLVHESERVVAFRDVSPQAPTHVLVIPRRHHRTVGALATDEPEALVELVSAAEQVAQDAGEDSFRLVFNTGERSGQSVFHVHGHVLAGRDMTWPPG